MTDRDFKARDSRWLQWRRTMGPTAAALLGAVMAWSLLAAVLVLFTYL